MSGLGWIFACAVLPCFIVALVGSACWPHANGLVGGLVAFGILLVVGVVGMIVGIVTDRGGGA